MPRIIKSAKEDASHSLEDLEVREVSVVDRPANKRRFLVVKCDAEESMAKDIMTVDLSVETDDAAARLLGLLDVDPPTPEIATSLEGLEVIFKSTTNGQALKRLTPVLQKLMDVVGEMKKLGDAEPSAKMLSTIKAVRAALDLASGGAGEETDETKKGDAGVKGAAMALQALIGLVNKLKNADADADIGDAEIKEMQKISLLLSKIAPAKTPDAEKDKAQKSDDTSAEIILKAGAKMRKARLDQLRKAVEILTLVLKELDTGDKDKATDVDDKKKEKDKKKVKTTKGEDGDDVDSLIESLQKQVADLTQKVEKAADGDDKSDLADVKSMLEGISKRLDSLENARPTGEGDSDPAPQPVKKQSLWAGVIR